MDNHIHYTPQALNDLEEIWTYISDELCNPSAARHTIDGILKAVERLKVFSGAGAVLSFSDGINSGYRFVRYGNYPAFYRVIESDVFVDRIIYGKRDNMSILLD